MLVCSAELATYCTQQVLHNYINPSQVANQYKYYNYTANEAAEGHYLSYVLTDMKMQNVVAEIRKI